METKSNDIFKTWSIQIPSSKKTRAVVWLPQDFHDDDKARWKERVAKDSTASRIVNRIVFLQPEKNRFLLHAFGPSGSNSIKENDLAAAAHVLLEQKQAKPESTVSFQLGKKTQTVILKPGNAQTLGEDTILIAGALEALIRSENEPARNRLVEQLRSPLGVIPFVGAGMSKAFGFPMWGEFLQATAERSLHARALKKMIEKRAYEDVADGLWERDRNLLQLAIDDTFCRRLDPETLSTGPLSFLAALIKGPVITTNFDQILEQTFAVCGNDFDKLIVGVKPNQTVKAIHQNRLALIKIHGDCEDETDRTFTKWEYDLRYKDNGSKRVTLTSLAWLMFTNRPLFFLGCSLEQDRTVEVLKEIHQTLGGLNHFAILAAHYSKSQLAARREALSTCGIIPLWFPPGNFKWIEEFMRELLDRASTRELVPATPQKRPALPRGKHAFKGLTTPPARSKPLAFRSDLKRIARAIVEGRTAFFLGTYAHLRKDQLGDGFYDKLATTFNVPTPKRDRSEIARYVRDRYGEKALLGEVKNMISSSTLKPNVIYQFLATLPGFLRAAGKKEEAFQFILTTNYDTILEQAFEAAGEPFHLFYYLGRGQDEGLFAHRTPDGRVRIIERPENIRRLHRPGSIIVKMSGGFAYHRAIPESVLIASGDFERLAGRLPDVLPAVIRQKLCERSLLFFGHGLREADVQALIRFAKEHGPTRESWAVQKKETGWDDKVAYWALGGLQIIASDLRAFVRALHTEVSSSG